MQNKLEEAGDYLKEGEFEKAKEIFSSLLDKDPENQDLISGFFVSSYWDNRIELIFNSKEGKERAARIVALFDEFEEEIRKRKIQRNQFFSNVTECVLGEASSQFRKAYQKEGMIGLEPVHLIQLTICLMKTRDYKNAKEILDYTKNFQKSSNETKFLEAECLAHLGMAKESRILYREAFLTDPTDFKPEMITSEPLVSIMKSLEGNFSDNDWKEFLPLACLEKNYFLDVKNYSESEIQKLWQEAQRLEDSLAKNDKYDFKIKCRLIQHLVAIYDASKNSSDREIAVSKLDKFEPEFFNKRKNSKIL